MAIRTLILCVCFLFASLYLARITEAEPALLRDSLPSFPKQIGQWQGQDAAPLDEKVAAVLAVDDYLSRIYFRAPREQVGLYIGFYQSQRQGSSIHSPLNCLPGAGWNPVDRRELTIPVGGNRNIMVNR